MSTYTDPLVDGDPPMSKYERQVWDALNEHWQRRNDRRELTLGEHRAQSHR
ncbi:hypothetical protein [Streptomyces sp. OP7]|uniref:hypothetical protein n=1 Tax=Streptomyces sp. OP7 TaxID=3142462 RepID=UPI0032E8728B